MSSCISERCIFISLLVWKVDKEVLSVLSSVLVQSQQRGDGCSK